MSREDVIDAVLGALGATEDSLTTDEIHRSVDPDANPAVIRVALRELTKEGEVESQSGGRWKVRAPPLAPPTVRSSGGFTDAELHRARERFGTTAVCPHCGLVGNTDQDFGWRRMRKEDSDVVPQSWCFGCRRPDTA